MTEGEGDDEEEGEYKDDDEDGEGTLQSAKLGDMRTATKFCTCRIIREALKLCKPTFRSVILN